MLPNKELIEITNELAVISRMLELHTSQGFYDINKICEDFFVPVLKIVFHCDDLINLNLEQENFPAVDLGSKSTRTCIQITTTRTSKKVNGTIQKFLDHSLHEQFDNLYVFILGKRQGSYTLKKTELLAEKNVKFSKQNIWGFEEFIEQIRLATSPEIIKITEYICSASQLMLEVDQLKKQLPKILSHASQKVARECNDDRYIPEVYTEPSGVKEQARFFTNPHLMYSKINFYLAQVHLDRINYLLQLSGEELIPLSNGITHFDSIEHLDEKKEVLLRAMNELSKHNYEYSSGPRSTPSAYRLFNTHIHISTEAYRAIRKIEKCLNFNELIKKNVFFITDQAGTGKTNFICDFIENYLVKSSIPTFFYTSQDVYFSNIRSIFDLLRTNKYLQNFNNEKLLQLFEHLSAELNTPIVIAIDGLNEAKKLSEFSYQLREFVEQLITIPNIKLLFTCRSEFFEERFSWIDQYPQQIVQCEQLFSFYDQDAHRYMIRGYLEHFNITAEIDDRALQQLRSPLLLRIFCEAHRNKTLSKVYSVYKHDLFRNYIQAKLKKLGSISSIEQRKQALMFLENIASAMLSLKQYSGISLSDVEGWETPIADAVISEGFILRKDSETESSYGEIVPTISFSFDQLRDFFIANVLIKIARSSPESIEIFSKSNSSMEDSIVEDVGYFLFCEVRKTGNRELGEKLQKYEWFYWGWLKGIFELEDRLITDKDEQLVRDHVLANNNSMYCISRIIERWILELRSSLSLNSLQIIVNELVANKSDAKFSTYISKTHNILKRYQEKKLASKPEHEEEVKKLLSLLEQ